MKELITTTHAPHQVSSSSELHRWLQQMDHLRVQFTPKTTPEHAAKLNAVEQLMHLKSYPFIQEKLDTKQVRIHAWYYDIGQSELEQWSDQHKMYIPISPNSTLEIEKHARVSAIHFSNPTIE
jgi:carbonic anhydrase